MPAPPDVGADAEFRPENALLPAPTTELESWSKSQRAGADALPVFSEDAVGATEWEPEDPETKFEDPDGKMLLPVSWAGTEGIEWLRPGDMHLTEPPKFKRLLAKNNPDADPDAEEPENPPPVVFKQVKKFAKVSNLEFYVRAASNPLQETEAITYHAVCAMNAAKSILAGTGQDVWDRIYPKNEQGLPRYNPGGKYIVKLNVMGQERTVTIDDQMPILDDACLLPRTKDKAEIWPLLLTKALLKALSVPKPPPAEDEEESEDAPKRTFPDMSHRDIFTFFVTCLTGWQPETVPIAGRSYDALDIINQRLGKGSVFPCGWGNHPQERMKYISSFSDSAAPGEHEEEPEHWDAQGNSAFMIKVDLDGSSNPAPPGSGSAGKATVELQIPRMQWLLPHRASPAPPPAEGEEGGEAAAEEGAEGAEGSQSGEQGKGRKMELMKPSIDVKYISGWPTFVQKMAEFIFFHNPSGYAHTTALDVGAAAAPVDEAAGDEGAEAPEQEAAEGEGGEGEEGAPKKEKPKPKAGISALLVENTSESDQDVLLCLSSTCFKCPLTVQELNGNAWELPAAGAAGGSGLRLATSAGYVPRQVVATDSNRALVLRVAPGSHVLQVLTPAGIEARLVASSEAVVELGDEAILCERIKLQMQLERGKAPPLASGKDILWLRRAISVSAPTTVLMDLRVADPALRDFAQLMLVNTSTGEMVEAANECLGPVLLEPSDSPYMLLVRSVIGDVPPGYDIASEEFVCPWLLRFICSSESAIKVDKMPTEFVLDANGYYVKNFGTELFRYQINPPAPPEAPEPEEGQEAPPAPAPQPVYMTVQLRTHSPALVDLYLLDVKTDQVWSQAQEEIDPIVAICNASMERDGKITTKPLHLKHGLTSVMLPELRLVHKPERQYILLARLVARQPPAVLKPVFKEAGEEAKPDDAEGEGGAEDGAEAVEGGEGGGGEEAPKTAAEPPPPEMVPVKNEIEEPGEEPFWSLRIFSTAETSEELVKRNQDKYEAIDAFVAECRENAGREAFKEALAKETAASGPVSAEPSQEAPPSDDAEPAGGEGEAEEEAAPEPWPPVKTEEQSWEEYLSEYRTNERLKPAPILIKRDPARGDLPSTTVQPPEFWTQQEEVCCLSCVVCVCARARACVCVCVCVLCVCVCMVLGRQGAWLGDWWIQGTRYSRD